MKLDGQFIECGVFRGGLSFLLAMMLRDSKSTKKVHLCDTFYGLPNPDRDFDKSYVQGGMACDRSEVEGSIRSLGIHNQCVIHEGLFADTFENLHGLDKVSFAHIDCDLYHGTKDCLEYLFPRLSYGAAVVIDDYYDESHGVMTALNEFAESNNIVIHLSTYGQAYFIKGEQALPSSKVTIGNHSVYMVTTSIVQDHAYLPLLERLLNFHETRINRLRNFISFCRREHV
jgi:O-methyltransferase